MKEKKERINYLITYKKKGSVHIGIKENLKKAKIPNLIRKYC